MIMRKKSRYTLSMVALAMFFSVPAIPPVYASDEINVSDGEDASSSTGDTYEYTSIDEDGNMEIVRLPEVNPEDIEQERIDQAESFDLILKLGNSEEVIASYDTYEDAQVAQDTRAKSRSIGTTSIEPRVNYANINYGIVNFHTKSSTQNTTYTQEGTGLSKYTNGAYAKDGAFLGYCDSGRTQVRFMQAGVIGCVNASEVSVISTDTSDSVYVSYYIVKNGTLYHAALAGSNYGSNLNVGPMQSYMKEGATYFSYDGHYFYLDFNTMIDDYKAGVYTHSINPNTPYYNYFQYLSHRTKTNYTAAQLDAFINAKTTSSSKLRGLGKYFIDYQNTYGSNAVLMLSTAINESYWGVSDIATAKNNLFGHKAYDSSPGLSSDAYATPQASIEDHAKNYVSRDYLDPKDAGKKYYGSNLGDKASGMNVKYASDPYWGEKAASFAYNIESYLGKKDFGDYEIGIKTSSTNVNIRSDASSSSYNLYQSGPTTSYPIVILGEKSGENVGGNNIWFKIQSDPTLNDNRTAMTQDVCVYNFNNAYAYMSSYYITPIKYSNVNSGDRPSETTDIITQAGFKKSGGYVSGIQPETSVATFTSKLKSADGSATITVKNAAGKAITSGNMGTGMTLSIVQKGITSNYNIVIYGDTNGDGKILANDYVFIRNHIMETTKLSGTYVMAADVNRDGKILANDYVFIRNFIMGSGSIAQ